MPHNDGRGRRWCRSVTGANRSGSVAYAMTPAILVIIQSDPLKTHRSVEGLRIALGLSTGSATVTIILLGQARIFLTEEAGEVVDAEILERHLPVVQELRLDIVVQEGSSADFSMDTGFAIREMPQSKIAALFCQASRVLVF